MAPLDLTMDLFGEAVARPDESVDLIEGALLIAQTEYPRLDRLAYRTRLAAMAREAGRVCGGEPLERLEALIRLLFERWGFHGNHDDYYDCRNSFLNDVLDLRTGIPITLSIVTIEVGRGAELHLTPVGLPGHFLVGVSGDSDLFVDPFSGGTLMNRAECIAGFGEMHPGRTFRPEYLAVSGRKQILSRMLNNLYAIYADTSRFDRALTVVEMMMRIEPAEAELLRRRSVVHQALNRYTQAIGDLEAYFERRPDSPDGADLRRRLELLHHLRNTIN